MGVDLGELCVKQPIRLEELAGRTLAIDAYNTLYQFLATIRQPDGTLLMDAHGRVTSHLTGLFNRTASLVEAGILPVFVFDGPPSPLKRATLDLRAQVKERARAAYDEALKAGDVERARMKAQQTSRLEPSMVAQAKDLLDGLGLPWVEAPGEGEAQAVFLVQAGAAWAVGSQDYDSVIFGAPRLVRNLSITGRRKLPGRQAWVDVEPELIPLSETLHHLKLSREQLIDVALLVGTDFNPGVPGIGPKTALDLLQEHRTLEIILEKAESEEGHVWKKLRAGQDGLGDFEAVRNLFLEPRVSPAPAIKPGRLDEGRVRQMLVDEHQFSADRVENQLARYRASKVYRHQRTLSDWG